LEAAIDFPQGRLRNGGGGGGGGDDDDDDDSIMKPLKEIRRWD